VGARTVVALALALSLSAGAAAPATDPAAVLKQAQELSGRGDFRGALALLKPAAEAPDLATADRVLILSRIALAHANLSDHEAARAGATRARETAGETADPKVRGLVAHLHGEVARLRGEGSQAIPHYEEGLDFARRAGDAGLARRCYRGLAAAYQSLGDWGLVLDYSRRAFESNPNPDDSQRAAYLMLQGIAHYEFRERDAAERHFLDLLELAERTGRRREVALALGELGMVYWEFDRDRSRSLHHFERALAVGRELGLPDLEATDLVNSGNVYRDGGDLEEALRRYRAALALTTKGGLLPVITKNIGQVLARLGRGREAEGWLLQAKEEADRIGMRHIRWESRMELGQLYAADRPPRADAMFRESLDVLEQHHANILLENYRMGALSRSLHKYDPYELYIEFLLAQGRPEDAFAVAERARARAFLDTLTGAREELASAAPDGYREREDALLARISGHQARLRTEALDASERAGLVAEVARAEADLVALRLRLAVDRPAVAEARYPRLWSVGELQQQVLRPGEALVMFFLGRRTSAAWVVTTGRLGVRTLPSRAVLEPAVRDYLQVLARPATGDAREQAAALSRLLDVEAIATLVADGGSGTRLIVIPHGVLHSMPVEALVTSGGQYLLERFIVSYAPSASSLAYLRGKGRRAEAGALVAIGDPLTGTAPAGDERSVRLETLSRLKRLPHSGRELRRISSLLAGPRVLDRERATEERLQQMDLAEASILHFATHGIIDEVQPERSGLALTPAPPAGDGLLQMREIYRLRLRAALVTLSACETALGQEVTGEGVVGLSRAFFYAGADSVLASLWNVGDASTADWMVHFYEGVRAGQPLDHAARDAKLAFVREGGRLAHPYYWAPFVLAGHATAVAPVRPATRWTPLAVGIPAGLLLAAVVAVARRRRAAAGGGVSSSSLPRAS
jgi:CHAT domain-containing protein/tetratricopeptide (TPR) repeat protein